MKHNQFYQLFQELKTVSHGTSVTQVDVSEKFGDILLGNIDYYLCFNLDNQEIRTFKSDLWDRVINHPMVEMGTLEPPIITLSQEFGRMLLNEMNKLMVKELKGMK